MLAIRHRDVYFLDLSKDIKKYYKTQSQRKYLLKDIPKILKFQSQRKNIFSSLNCKKEKLGI